MPLPFDTVNSVYWVKVGDRVSGSDDRESPENQPNIPMSQLLDNIYALRDARTVMHVSGPVMDGWGGEVELNKTPFSENEVDVYFNGSLQTMGVHYTVDLPTKTITIDIDAIGILQDTDIFIIKSRGYDAP